jgi:hypothetical protein
VDNPIGQWLRDTRLRQVMPGTRKPWSQDYLLERMQKEVKWAPHRPNYSKYENGKATPEPDTLDKFMAFWTARGEAGPDLSPPVAPEPTVDPIVAATDRQTEAIRENTAMLKAVLDALTSRLPTPPEDPQVQEAREAWAEAEQQLSSRPRGTTTPPRKPSRGRQSEAQGSASRMAEQS